MVNEEQVGFAKLKVCSLCFTFSIRILYLTNIVILWTDCRYSVVILTWLWQWNNLLAIETLKCLLP